MDVGVIGVPLSRSSISASGASETPWAVRQSWKSFSTYDVDHDADLTRLNVRDLGDVRMHVTDIPLCHHYIEKGMEEVYEKTQKQDFFLPVIIGGDHSITCPSVKAWKKPVRPARPVCSSLTRILTCGAWKAEVRATGRRFADCWNPAHWKEKRLSKSASTALLIPGSTANMQKKKESLFIPCIKSGKRISCGL